MLSLLNNYEVRTMDIKDRSRNHVVVYARHAVEKYFVVFFAFYVISVTSSNNVSALCVNYAY